MAGCYPGITCLCMMGSAKVNINWKRILFILAFLQIFGWTFDVIENYYLLKWLKNPVMGDEFGFYHVVVYSKWAIALTAHWSLYLYWRLLYSRKKICNLKSEIWNRFPYLCDNKFLKNGAAKEFYDDLVGNISCINCRAYFCDL
jgi:hypothetical protein